MGVRRALGVGCAAIVAASLAWPSAGVADHVTVDGSVAAEVKRAGSDSWRVEVDFTIGCRGAGATGASYQGNLYLVDQDTAERIYLGGAFGASGEVDQLVHSKDRWQRLTVLLEANCFDNETLHGSGPAEIRGGFVAIPPRLGGGGTGGGGGQDGAGGDDDRRGDSDPTGPLGPGGCLKLIVGSSGADTLLGGPGGDVVFALAATDQVRGGPGHDCLLGEAGRDRLRGEAGHDRLTGGAGADRLLGGAGVNAYDAGPGRDFVDARNGAAERVRCGSGRDRVRADADDTLRSCEVVSRPGAA